MKTLKNSIVIALLFVMISCSPSSSKKDRRVKEVTYKYQVRTNNGYWFLTNDWIEEDGWVIFIDKDKHKIRIPIYNVEFIKDEK